MAIGRFQVMALLQAARAFLLGLPLETAKSWGLNRAIFYAAAKKGFKRASTLTSEYKKAKAKAKEEGEVALDVLSLGDEVAFKEVRDGKIYLTIGGEIQTERDFERQVESRFAGAFQEAWEEALDMLRKVEREVLLSQRAFYERVYRPLRDELVKRWNELIERRMSEARARLKIQT